MTTSDDPELEARVRARVGSTLRGKYQLDGVLGIGGMAAVYSATHRNGRKVAVKLLHPELSFSGEAKSRFLREGLVANTVKHPGVVTILDDDTNDDGAAFLVMELLVGTTLDELWERCGRRLPLPAVVTVGVMLLDILSAAHAAGVVHRDIKPANLFMTEAWELKILDFGISRLRDARSATETQTGMMMGSPAFVASEQALGRSDEIDGRTDLWSAAASLFTLASGQFVHEGQTAQEMLIRAATTPVRSFAAAMPEAPALVVAVVDRALAFANNERWATASEMAVALSEAARASFGEGPSTNAFVPLVPYMPVADKGKSVPPPRASLHSAGASGPLGTPRLAPMRPVGPGFTQLTSSISGPIGAPGSRRRKRTMILGGIALFGVLMGTAVLVGRASRGSEVGAAGRASEPTSAEGPANASAEGERAERAADIARPIANPSASSSASSSTATPAIDVSALSAAPRPAAAPRGAPAPRATGKANGKPSSFIPPPRSTAPPAADPCNPPYRSDFFGNKVAKPGCSL